MSQEKGEAVVQRVKSEPDNKRDQVIRGEIASVETPCSSTRTSDGLSFVQSRIVETVH